MSRTLLKSWTFQSNSNPNKNYETLQYDDGYVSCNCRGWTFAKNGVRSCTHTRKVDQGIADGAALSVWNQQTVAPLPIRQPQRALPDADLIQLAPTKAKKVRVKKAIVEPVFDRIVNWRD